MRRALLTLAVVAGISLVALPNRAHAQLGTGVGADPFSFYYGYYLPHQAAIAAQSTPMDTLNANAASRQFNAVRDRSTLYDPISPYGDDEEEPFSGRSRARERRAAKVENHALNPAGSRLARGGGPQLYYNRTAAYYPTMRVGRGPNKNLATFRRGRGGMAGGMGGMGGFGGLPGPR